MAIVCKNNTVTINNQDINKIVAEGLTIGGYSVWDEGVPVIKTYDCSGYIKKELTRELPNGRKVSEADYYDFDCIHPVKVWFNPPYTTAMFYNDAHLERVTVKRESEGRFDEFGEFCRCIAKCEHFHKFLPKILLVKQEGPMTKLIFEDFHDVSVTCSDLGIMTPECGLAIAMCKAVFGSTGNLLWAFKRAKENTEEAKRVKEVRKKLQKERAAKEIERRKRLAKERFEESVRVEMMRIKVHMEAERRLKEKGILAE